MSEHTHSLRTAKKIVAIDFTGDRINTLVKTLACIAIVASAFHFWPFSGNKVWQLLCPSNLVILIWIAAATLYFTANRGKLFEYKPLPHISVIAFLCIGILSIAFTPDRTRSALFMIKIFLMFIGAYSLFSFAIVDLKSLRAIFLSIIIATTIAVVYCFAGRILGQYDSFGFHQNPFKYGTYIGIAIPLSCTFLFLSNFLWPKVFASLLVLMAIVSSGSIGGVLAIILSLTAIMLFIPDQNTKMIIAITLALAVTLAFIFTDHEILTHLKNDITPTETNSKDLKQRYIEWQAEINLLEKRCMTGTGAGCINEYRSEFYYRLPKLNTLMPFDQNGWLATGAECGLMSLVMFCWVCCHYLKKALSNLKKISQINAANRLMLASTAGFVGALFANMFSSVFYNGLTLLFVLNLVLIDQRQSFLPSGDN
jgi:hypothetical protein